MKIYLLQVLLIFSLHHTAISQNVPHDYKKPVIFIFIKNGDGVIVPNGTGFFVGKYDSAHKINFVYLITAKHVIQEHDTKQYFDQIYIRINKRNSNFDTVPLEMITAHKFLHFVTSENASVDLAVIPLAPDQNKYDYLYFPDNMLFKTRQEFDSSYVKEGTNVFYSGLFSPYLGYKSNSPIIRFGKVALIPSEKISWDSAKEKQDLFLVETTTYGGNSGSPLFSYIVAQQYIGGNYSVGNNPPKLAGVVKGYSGEKAPIEYIESSMSLTYTSNIGITAVIPSYLISEILESDVLVKDRESILKSLKK